MVLGAVVGIAIVSALVFAAWKSGDDAQTQQPPPAAIRLPAEADLVVRATRGTTQLEIRDNSRFGRERFSGTLTTGRQQRIALRGRLWLWIQRPNAVDVVFAGSPQQITARRPTAYLVTKRGVKPAN